MSDLMLRYWCSIDDSSNGQISLAYADAFHAMGLSMRIIATKMSALGDQTREGSAWHRHRGSFLTPVVNQYVNVVCGDPADWRRLYTVGVKNVLICDEPPSIRTGAPGLVVPIIGQDGKPVEVVRPPNELALEVALKYQVLLVPSEEISSRWEALGAHAVVIPMDLGRRVLELRSALFDP